MDISTDRELEILSQGEITLKGEFLWGSNYTFLVELDYEGTKLAAVYKPVRGEQPLWDFPAASLARREAAAFVVSQALGWRLVPATIYRKKGPLGAGSLQVYVDHDPEYHYFNFTQQDKQRLRPVAVFDLLINNADRKGSHILKSPDGHLWLIDHGVCFHVENKLRTVIWDFVGEQIPQELCADLQRLHQEILHLPDFIQQDDAEGTDSRMKSKTSDISLTMQLSKLLSQAEIRALGRRAELIARQAVFSAPDPNRRPVPWPQL